MALVRGSRASPNERLVQAISNFANELSPEQRDQLQDNRSHSLGMDDVMSLTAEIDLLATTRATEFRRCYGPRITSFLDGIQEFAKVADIAVGAEKSSTASGVWAAVRFLLLAGTQAPNPYIDKLSALFLTLGRSAHRFRDMAILFPRSPNLRDAVFEYYIIIVDMCCEILKLSKKSNLARYWTVFAEETYTAKLDRYAKQIMQELVLEGNRVAVEESRKSSIFRAQSKQHMLLQKHHRSRVLRKQLLDACSKHDYQTTWKQTRDLGTTLLFNDSEAYREWKQSRKSCTLLYHGKLGSGKSVLLANVVGDLHLQQDPPRQVVYFFCRHDLLDSLLPRTIFGCIARQLLQYRPDLEELASSITLDSQTSIKDMLDLIKNSTALPIYLVLDGIEACKPEHREEILQNLQHLQQDLVFNICISTRETSSQNQYHEAMWLQVLTARLPEPNPDVESYIEHKIDDCLKTGKLIINEATLVAKVKASLRSKAEGMFLWVYLQIICLCLMESDHDIEQSLESLPSGLSETYSRILRHQTTSRYRDPLFELIMVAREPLTTSQLQEALSIEPGNTNFDPAKLLNSIDRVIKSSAGLVIIDEEEDTARFVHHSAVDFLTSTNYEPQIDLERVSQRMAHSILTYLNYSLWETQLTERESSKFTVEAIPAAILMSMLPGGRKIIKPSRARNHDLNLARCAQPDIMRRKDFAAYAQSHWLPHIVAGQLDTDYLSLLRNALSKGRIPLSVSHQSRTPLQESVIATQPKLVEFFLKFAPDIRDKEEALRLAALHDSEYYMFNYGPSSNDTKTTRRLSTSRVYSFITIITLLAAHCLHLKQDRMLVLSIRYDSPAMWRTVLENYPKIDSKALNREYDFNTVEHDGTTRYSIKRYTLLTASLILSSDRNPGRMSRILLDGPRVDPLQRCQGKTPLEHAVAARNVTAVQLLSKYYNRQIIGLEMEREIWTLIFSLDDMGTSEAQREALVAIVRSLLFAPCLTLDCDTTLGVTPLMHASRLNMLSMVRVMLEINSGNVNARSRTWSRDVKSESEESTQTRRHFVGKTAWDYTTSSKIKELLEEHGGKSSQEIEIDSSQFSFESVKR